jgi:hypothetical protein
VHGHLALEQRAHRRPAERIGDAADEQQRGQRATADWATVAIARTPVNIRPVPATSARRPRGPIALMPRS